MGSRLQENLADYGNAATHAWLPYSPPLRRAPNWRPHKVYTLLSNNSGVEGREDAQNGSVPRLRTGARWKTFLEEKTRRLDGGWEYIPREVCSLVTPHQAHQSVVHVPGPHLGPPDARNNQPDRKQNARLRQMLRDHCGMPDPTHQSRVLWCCTHLRPQPAASCILATMLTRTHTEKRLWQQAAQPTQAYSAYQSPAGATQLSQRTPPHHSPLPQITGTNLLNQHVSALYLETEGRSYQFTRRGLQGVLELHGNWRLECTVRRARSTIDDFDEAPPACPHSTVVLPPWCARTSCSTARSTRRQAVPAIAGRTC